VTEPPKKDQLYELIRANPFISQQDLADQLRLSRSAVAGHIAGLIPGAACSARLRVYGSRRSTASARPTGPSCARSPR
jgi:pseudouridine kinase